MERDTKRYLFMGAERFPKKALKPARLAGKVGEVRTRVPMTPR
jgi:hypothetical protein